MHAVLHITRSCGKLINVESGSAQAFRAAIRIMAQKKRDKADAEPAAKSLRTRTARSNLDLRRASAPAPEAVPVPEAVPAPRLVWRPAPYLLARKARKAALHF